MYKNQLLEKTITARWRIFSSVCKLLSLAETENKDLKELYEAKLIKYADAEISSAYEDIAKYIPYNLKESNIKNWDDAKTFKTVLSNILLDDFNDELTNFQFRAVSNGSSIIYVLVFIDNVSRTNVLKTFIVNKNILG